MTTEMINKILDYIRYDFKDHWYELVITTTSGHRYEYAMNVGGDDDHIDYYRDVVIKENLLCVITSYISNDGKGNWETHRTCDYMDIANITCVKTNSVLPNNKEI